MATDPTPEVTGENRPLIEQADEVVYVAMNGNRTGTAVTLHDDPTCPALCRADKVRAKPRSAFIDREECKRCFGDAR